MYVPAFFPSRYTWWSEKRPPPLFADRHLFFEDPRPVGSTHRCGGSNAFCVIAAIRGSTSSTRSPRDNAIVAQMEMVQCDPLRQHMPIRRCHM